MSALLPTDHARARRGNRYVYVVRSRRSRGLSVGINLDPQKTCNFDCVYCEVIDRREIERKTGRPPIDPDDVVAELTVELRVLAAAAHVSGGAAAEHVRDIAYAGDGEPSTFPGFLGLAEKVFDARDAAGLSVPVVLITNGSGLGRLEMRDTHDLFARRNGVFWVKLDAGTDGYFRSICRTAVPFERILANLGEAARRHPIVVQSMFLRYGGEGPSAHEIEAYAHRLAEVRDSGGRVSLVQVYTVARDTMEPGAAPLSKDELERIAQQVQAASPGLAVEVFS